MTSRAHGASTPKVRSPLDFSLRLGIQGNQEPTPCVPSV